MPSIFPTTAKSAFEKAYHASRATSMCELNVNAAPSSSRFGIANREGLARTNVAVSTAAPTTCPITSAQNPDPRSASTTVTNATRIVCAPSAIASSLNRISRWSNEVGTVCRPPSSSVTLSARMIDVTCGTPNARPTR